MKPNIYTLALGLLTVGLLAGSPATAQSTPGQKGKVSDRLLALAGEGTRFGGAVGQRSDVRTAQSLPVVPFGEATANEGYVAIEAISEGGDADALLRDLRAQGLVGGAAYGALVSGVMPVSKVPGLAKLPTLRYVRPAPRPVRRVGAVTSEGVRALGVDEARELTGLTGEGIKIGILSDSYNNLGGEAAGIASGDLPPEGVEVLLDLPPDTVIVEADTIVLLGIDEGRGMAELIYDVAPGADMAFRTAFLGAADFAQGIGELREAGCDVIVDDIGYLTQPFFSNGVIAQAANDVVHDGAAYFSAAGNSGDDSYESPFRAGGDFVDPAFGNLGVAHDFGGGDVRQRFEIVPGGDILLSLQWDDPYFSANGKRGAQTDLDAFIFFGDILITGSADANIGADPVEFFGVTNTGDDTVFVDVVITKFEGPAPKLVKYINFGSGSRPVEFDTRGSTIFGHPNAANAIAVGAAAYFNTEAFNDNVDVALINGFSSVGGTPILFDDHGRRFRWPRVSRKPELVSPDGTNTTFFGGFDFEGDGFPNFFGTSAAAPHLAAVGALALEATRGWLPPRALEFLLVATAEDMDDPTTEGFDRGFDFRTGYGFARADKALGIFAKRGRGVASRSTPTTEDDIRRMLDGDPDRVALAGDAKIYPNPSSGFVTYQAFGELDEEVVLTLHDAVGREVLRTTTTPAIEQTVDLTSLPRGVYVARLRVGDEVTTENLVLD